MSERKRTIWAYRRTHLLNGRTGFITVPDSIAREAIARKFAAASYSGMLKPDGKNAPFADDAPREPREHVTPLAELPEGFAPMPPGPIAPIARDADGNLTTADLPPVEVPAPVKRPRGRPRKNPAD